MGCTTSVVLLEGLLSILERNCGYIKGAAEPGALAAVEEEEEETPSLRGSQLWIPTTALVKARHVRTFSTKNLKCKSTQDTDSGVF